MGYTYTDIYYMSRETALHVLANYTFLKKESIDVWLVDSLADTITSSRSDSIIKAAP